MKYLFDTNIISELIIKRPNQKVIQWIDNLDPDTIYLSVLTIGEIRKGIEKLPSSRRKDLLKEWLHDELLTRFSGKIVELSLDVLLTWGELTGRLESEGKKMSAIDSLIAATVLHGGYILVTRNEDDFQHAGIGVVNPWN